MLWAQPAYMPAVMHRPEVTLTSNRAELWGFSLLHTSQSLKLVGWMNYASRLSDSETVWPRPWLAAPAISHEPNKNVFSIGGAARLCCLKKEKKKKERGRGGAPFLYPDSPPQSHLLPLTSFNSSPPCSHLSTHFNTHAHTKPPSGPCGRGQGGSGRINFLPWPSTKLLPGTAVTGGKEKKKEKKRRRNEQKVRWRYQTRRNTYHWFHCWSPRLPLSKCRTSEEDKTYRER